VIAIFHQLSAFDVQNWTVLFCGLPHYACTGERSPPGPAESPV